MLFGDIVWAIALAASGEAKQKPRVKRGAKYKDEPCHSDGGAKYNPHHRIEISIMVV